MDLATRMAPISIRHAQKTDLGAVIDLDEVTPRQEKPTYWREIFNRYVAGEEGKRIFLVAESGQKVLGFIVGEIRAWEFGSPPCGWVFALAVSAEKREAGVGERLLEELCRRLRQAGITTLRTMVDRNNKLTLSFFRSQGLRTGPYIELEKPVD